MTIGMNTKWPVACLLLVLVLLGCGSRESALVGVWEGEVAIPENLTSNKEIAATMEGLNRKASLTLREDKTFILQALAPSEGAWSFKEDVLTLTLQKVDGKEIATLKAEASKVPGITKEAIDMIGVPIRFKVDSSNRQLTSISDSGQATLGQLKLTKSDAG